MRARASPPKRTSFAAMFDCPYAGALGFDLLRGLLLGDRRGIDDAHDVRLLHDEEILAIKLDLAARPFAEQDVVTLLDVERNERAFLVPGARADGDDLAFHRLFLGGIGDEYPACGLAFFFDPANHHAIVQRPEFHGVSSWFLGLPSSAWHS